MFTKKIVKIGLVGFSASAILIGNPAFGQNVTQEFNGRAIGPETSVSGSNLTINPRGKLRQTINCEARNYSVPLDPRCDASNTAIYKSRGHKHPKPPDKGHHGGDNGGHKKPGYNIKQKVQHGGNNTTVIAPATANSSSKSRATSLSESNSKAGVRNSGNSNNTNLNVSKGGSVRNSGNSSNTNLNVNQGGKGGSAKIGDQKNQMSVTTGATNVSPSTSVSPSTKVKVDGDEYNNIQFASPAPGTGGEAFAFHYRSACGTSVNYRQGFALKPRRIAGGGFGYALDISHTKMDTIENRGSVQNKMNTAFETAIGVVNNQQAFEQRLNTGGVSRQEAETHAIANCTPFHNKQRVVQVSNPEPPIDKPRTCTARGCN